MKNHFPAIDSQDLRADLHFGLFIFKDSLFTGPFDYELTVYKDVNAVDNIIH
jgi:hypothetical protein